MAKTSLKTAPHLAFQTKLSREGQVDMVNRKPYRTIKQKAMAREDAVKCKDGAYRSNVPVSFHKTAASVF